MKALLSKLIAFSVTASFLPAQNDTVEQSQDYAKVGKTAPAFTLHNANGEKVSLSDYKGKTVVLEWVNFDCPFVKKHYDNGDMQKLQKTYTEKGVAWLLIHSAHADHPTFKTGEELLKVATKKELAATNVLIDIKGNVGKTYKAKTTPHMFVIDKEGTLTYAGAIDSIKSANPADVKKADNYVVLALDALEAGKEVETAETKAYGCSVKY